MGNGTRILRIERIKINKNQLNPFDPRPIAIFYLPKTLFGNKSMIELSGRRPLQFHFFPLNPRYMPTLDFYIQKATPIESQE